jgi:hypothetical protein
MKVYFTNVRFNLFKTRARPQHFNDFSLFRRNINFVDPALPELIVFLLHFNHISILNHR